MGHRPAPAVTGERVASALRVTEWQDETSWEAFVDAAPHSTVMHRWAWRDVVERAYGHRSVALAAVSDGEVRGVLPLTLVRSRLFGRHLVSMPFMDYGGACALDETAEQALVQAAVEMASSERATLDLRHTSKRPIDLPVSLEKATMLLQLGTTDEETWRRLPSERRNRIRKAQREGLSASIGGEELLPAFYEVFAENMRDLGSPVHAFGFFHEAVAWLPDHAHVIVAAAGGRPVAGAVMLVHRGTVSIPWVSSLRSARTLSAGQFLYWEAMRWAIAHGHRTLDFGRSSKGSGTYESKRQWGAEPQQLYWHYWPESAPPPAETAQRLDWVGKLWRRTPLPLATALGPRLRRGIAN